MTFCREFSNSFAASLIFASLLSFIGPATAATPPAPTLLTPANLTKDWLFNFTATGTRQSFSWNPSSGATAYDFVLSISNTFQGYDETTSACLALASGCKSLRTSNTSASATSLNSFLFMPGTYYWKVRAISAGGKGAWSVTRSFTTTNRASIVSQALAYSSSPQSRVDRTDGGSVTWLTELDAKTLGDDMDGALLRNAWWIYGSAAAPRNLGTSSSPTTLRTNMRNALNRSNGWLLAERDKLIDQIAATYVPASLTRNGLLSTMRIRAQCKEFADRMVIAGGGTAKTYPGMGAAKLDVRPGMYVTWKSNAHAAIVNGVQFNSTGAVYARISEANWGNTWGSNPVGQVPWQRTVSHTRLVQITTSGDYRAYAN